MKVNVSTSLVISTDFIIGQHDTRTRQQKAATYLASPSPCGRPFGCFCSGRGVGVASYVIGCHLVFLVVCDPLDERST